MTARNRRRLRRPRQQAPHPLGVPPVDQHVVVGGLIEADRNTDSRKPFRVEHHPDRRHHDRGLDAGLLRDISGIR